MKRLKQACKLQSKIKWSEQRVKQEEKLHASFEEILQLLNSDRSKIMETDVQVGVSWFMRTGFKNFNAAPTFHVKDERNESNPSYAQFLTVIYPIFSYVSAIFVQ
jgi:hypothetical protein